MAQRLIIDGIRVEGEAAQKIIQEVMYDIDASGTPQRLAPLNMIVVVAVSVGVVTGLTGYLLQKFAGGLPTAWYIAICIGVSLVVSAISSRIYLRSQRRRLREALRRRGFDLCAQCGYWLKGLSAEQALCPECGTCRASD